MSVVREPKFLGRLREQQYILAKLCTYRNGFDSITQQMADRPPITFYKFIMRLKIYTLTVCFYTF